MASPAAGVDDTGQQGEVTRPLGVRVPWLICRRITQCRKARSASLLVNGQFGRLAAAMFVRNVLPQSA